jgi:hypothetical protein
MLPIASGIDVGTADVPGIYPYLPKAGYVMARRKPPAAGSTFAALLEPYPNDGERPVRDVELLSPPAADADAPVAVKVTLADGKSDLLISGAMPSIKAGELAVTSDAALARVRLDTEGKPEALFAIEGKRLSAGDVTLRLDSERYEGAIDGIDFDQNILYTAADLPAGSALAGQLINLGNDATGHRSSYRIDHVSHENGKSAIHLSPTTLILGRIHLDRDPPDGKTLPNIVPLEYAKSLAHKDSGFFTGKTVATANGRARTSITGFDGAKGTTISVSDASGFRRGDDAVIYDAQPGDHFTIPCWGQITRNGAGGTWQCRSNVPVAIETQGQSQRFAPSESGR